MRKKETSTDYRFLIDPDIPPLVLSQTKDLDVEALLAGVPELPEQGEKRKPTPILHHYQRDNNIQHNTTQHNQHAQLNRDWPTNTV